MSQVSEVRAIEQDGELWLNAAQLIAHMRGRASRWDAEATGDEETTEQQRAAYWGACAAFSIEADALDLECLARVNGG